MNEQTSGARTPWHFWAVSIVGLPWNAFGCFDYFMSKTQGDAYLQSAGMTQTQIDYFNAMPVWMTAVWAVGVWGALLGTVLLLLRSKWALHVYIASLAAYVLSLVYNYVLSDGAAVMGDASGAMWIMQLVILAGCLFFAWYAWFATKRGLLR